MIPPRFAGSHFVRSGIDSTCEVSSPLNSPSLSAPSGADLPEFHQAAGAFERQLGVLLFRLRQFVAAHGAGGEAAVEDGGDGFPVQSGDAAGDQHAVVAQALHDRADHLDARAGQFGEGCDRLGVFPLLRKASSSGSVSLPCLASEPRRSGGAAVKSRVRDISRLAPAAASGDRDRGFPRTDAAARATAAASRTASVALRSNCWRCSAGRSTRMPVSTASVRIGLRLLQHDGIAGSPTSARRDW